MKKNDDVLDGKVIKIDSEESFQNYMKLNAVVKYQSRQFFSIPIEVLNKCSYQASICYAHILWRSNVGNVISNTALAKLMNCTTRTITNLIDELTVKGCITVYFVNKTTRYIYPNYILPTALVMSKDVVDTAYERFDDESEQEYRERIENGGFKKL